MWTAAGCTILMAPLRTPGYVGVIEGVVYHRKFDEIVWDFLALLADILWGADIGGVPTTPDPNTSAKVSRYKWEAYRDTNWWCIYHFLPGGGHTFAEVCHRNGRCIAILFKSIECAGRRLVEIGGRLPTATQLHQSFTKILVKHLASNKKVNFVFQQKSSTIPMMNPSPTEIVELFSFVEVTLIQYAYYATVAGHFPGDAVSSVKPKPKKVNKVEVTPDESTKGEMQINATTPTTPRPKSN